MRQKEREIIEIAGVEEVIDKKGRCSESSRSSVIIRFVSSTTEQLTNKKFQIDQALKLWNGLHGNLPYGIYKEFVEIILRHKKFMEERKDQ